MILEVGILTDWSAIIFELSVTFLKTDICSAKKLLLPFITFTGIPVA